MSEYSHRRANTDNETISDETVLKIAKEIAIKFIETGRITPATFDQTFRNIHTSIKETVLEK